mgnify:FL=1
MTENLEYRKAIAVKEEIETDGHRPLLVITDNFKSYYIKNSRDKFPAYHLINEFLCHYLQNIWNIQTPNIAAVNVNQELLPPKLSSFHKPHYYNPN